MLNQQLQGSDETLLADSTMKVGGKPTVPLEHRYDLFESIVSKLRMRPKISTPHVSATRSACWSSYCIRSMTVTVVLPVWLAMRFSISLTPMSLRVTLRTLRSHARLRRAIDHMRIYPYYRKVAMERNRVMLRRILTKYSIAIDLISIPVHLAASKKPRQGR